MLRRARRNEALGAPTLALMARYRDKLVREDGKWKFARRDVESPLPAPPRR